MRIFIVFFSVISLSPACCLGDQQSHADFLKLVEQAWQRRLDDNPLFASRLGDPRGDGKLPRVGLAAQAEQEAFYRELLEKVEAIDPAKLPADERTNYAMFLRSLRNNLSERQLKMHLMPITNRSGFHIRFPELPELAPPQTEDQYRNYISRLNAFARYADEHIELMRKGIQEKRVLPAVVLEGFNETVDPHIVDDPSDSLLYSPFREFPAEFSEKVKDELTTAGRQAIQRSVVDGYRRFGKFLAEEYIPAARSDIGASAMPGGRELYRHRVRMFTTLDLTPEAVHQIGLDEVGRIRKEMSTIPPKVGFEGSHADFVKHLRTDPKFYPTTKEQLLKEVAYALKRMDGKLPELFGKLPRTPYGIKEIPAYVAPRTTSAYYMQPAADGSRAGFYYVNTYNLKSRPLFEVEALSLHEAVPGHHLQLALQMEMEGLPQFRKFAEVTAFVEGWALYAERLGLEVGFYQDPYSDFGRLSFEMWRACRLVVDTGIHYLGWTRQQAIEFMADNTALSLHNIQAEVDRYIAWPGQALAYKMGELKIRQLRKYAEEKLGDKFRLPDFHDAVLAEGAVPLSILEQNVKRYAAK